MSGRFDGVRAVVTGCSRGLGRAIFEKLKEEGAQVMGLARVPGDLGEAVLAGDVARPEDAQALADKAAARWGALDLLINNAAVITDWEKNLETLSPGELRECFAVNVFGPQYVSQALIPLLLKGREPRIVNVSSEAGSLAVLRAPERKMPAYRWSKYCLNGLTMMYAEEFRGKIAVNSVHPGWIRTDMGGPQASDSPERGAARVLELAAHPFATTGQFWNGDSRDRL